MNFFQRIKAALQLIFNRYEAANPFHRDRTIIPGAVQDARFDASCAARTELMRKARYFEQNSALAQRIGSVFADYTVGATGLQINPASTDMDWNKAAKLYWNTASNFLDLNSRQNFGTLQGLLAWRWLFDGEIFVLKTRGQTNSGRTMPRIQLLESHRVGTPPDKYQDEGKSIIDGVAIDGDGRPTGYWIRDSSSSYEYKLKDAKDVLHLFEPSRPGEYRGVSFFHAVLNDLHRLDDLEMLEMRAVADAAEKSTFIKNAAGEIPLAKLRQYRLTGTGPVGADNAGDLEKRVEYFRDIYGGRMGALRTGEEVTQFVPNRPTESTRALWDYLTSKICIGIGIPKQLVMPYSIQGTVVRGDYDVANAFFKSRSAIVAALCQDIYLYVIGWGVRTDPTIADPPADKSWFNVTIRPPRAVNVDVGRNSSAMLAELAAGATNYELIYSPLGLDWREELTKLADQIQFIHELADARGIEAGEIREQAGAVVPTDIQPAETIGASEELKAEFDAYGVGVRAGAITPTPADEEHFRAKAKLPPTSQEALESWREENNTRRPITLQPIGGQTQTTQPAMEAPADA